MIKGLDPIKLVQMFSKLSKREKMIFYVMATVVSLTLMDQAIIRPIFKTLGSLDRQISELETNIKKSIRLLGQKERMNKESEYFATFASRSKSPEEGALALLKSVQEIANDSSINLLYVKPAGGSTTEEAIYRVNLECEGQVDQLINFFYAIENSKLLLRIEKYTLQPTAKGSSVMKCVATVSMAGVQ